MWNFTKSFSQYTSVLEITSFLLLSRHCVWIMQNTTSLLGSSLTKAVHYINDGLWATTSRILKVWTPPYLYLPVMNVQNVFIICLLLLPLTCGTHLKAWVCTWCYDIDTLLLVLFHVLPWCMGRTGNCGTGQIMLWQVNYYVF